MSNNQLDKVALSRGAQFQVDLVNQIDKATQEMGQEFTPYGRQCVINAMANLINTCKTNDIRFDLIDQTMVKVALQNVGYTELNFNATPAEAYFDLRKATFKDKEGKAISGYSIAIRPQGAGNEKLTRRFGVNVLDLKQCILVREGDDYELPSFDGTKMTAFTWKPKSLDKKVIMVVYPLLKKDGSIEYLMASREGIKPNLIAQVRQNNLYTFMKTNAKGYREVDTKAREDFYEMVNAEFEKLTVDQILADPRWRKELTPTYTSGGSQEAMIIRKMKNNALKQYPREFDSAIVADAVKDMWEDKDDSLLQKKEAIDVDPIEKVENEIQEEPSEEAIEDFQVDEDGVVESNEPTETPVGPGSAPAADTYEEDL